MPGVISIDHGARADFIIPEKLDRGGAINTIAPEGLTSKHAAGQATSGYLAEVERVSMAQMEEWRSEVSRSLRQRVRPGFGSALQRLGRGGEVAMAKKVFVIDMAKCNGCHNCQIVCKDEHVGNDWSPMPSRSPRPGSSGSKLTEKVRGTVPKVKVAYRPHLCMHCDDAPCIEACPVEGAIYKREDGLVIIDPVKCTGCKNCVDACPYDVIFFNEDLNIAQKCTGCAHLLDDGWDEPRCADACPTLAIRFMDEDEAKELIAQGRGVEAGAQGPGEAPGLLPQPAQEVHRRHVYEPVEEEVVIGATATLEGAPAARSSPPRPTPTATSGSKASTTACTTWS